VVISIQHNLVSTSFSMLDPNVELVFSTCSKHLSLGIAAGCRDYMARQDNVSNRARQSFSATSVRAMVENITE